jgi:Fic family protein
MLIQERRLTTPLLYLSGYLESHRREYYDRLQAVRERGEVQEWLQFFLAAVKKQAEDGVWRASKLIELREGLRAEAAQSRSRVGALIDLMFSNPYLTVKRVEFAAKVTNQGARNLLGEAESRGWCRRLGPIGQGRRTYWLAQEIWRVTEAEPSYQFDEPDAASTPEES